MAGKSWQPPCKSGGAKKGKSAGSSSGVTPKKASAASGSVGRMVQGFLPETSPRQAKNKPFPTK